MALAITSYTPGDYDDVWSLHLYTIRNNDGFVKNIAFHTDLLDIPAVYQAFFIARDEGAMAGMVGLKKIDDETLEVKRLQVPPAFQGKGYSKKLMAHAEDYARRNAFNRLVLDLSKSSVTARKLYDSLDYQVTKEQTETYGPDNEPFEITYMQKRL